MNNDIIDIKEQFKIDDSHSKIRGFLCAYDEEGKLVFRKENMIVESGRRYIMKNGINENTFKYAKLSSNSNAVTPGDNLSTLTGDVRTTRHFEEPINDGNFDTFKISYQNPYTLRFPIDPLFINVKCNGEDYQLYKDYTLKKKNANFYATLQKGLTEIEYEENRYIWNGTSFELKTYDFNYFSYFIDDENLVVKCLIIFNDNQAITANSLGLVVLDKTKDTTKQTGKNYYNSDGEELTGNFDITQAYEYQLFSRVTFPTYYKSTTQRLTFRYYIYF